MLERHYASLVNNKLRKFPAVAILGPRQCGKPTLARALAGRYFDLESERSYLRLDAEWDALAAGNELVVIDEAQEQPEVFRRLRGTIDADRVRRGRYLLLGSVSPGIMRAVGESLAGRLGRVEMGPLNLLETGAHRLDDLWLRGGFPDGGILDLLMFPKWQDDYLSALVSRDLPRWGLPAKPITTLRLLRMLAALQAQPLNAVQIGNSLSLDGKTVATYIDFLEAAYLIRRLPPFFANLPKRLVKTPRLYVRDSGLLHALLRVPDRDSLYTQPWVWHSWEGFIIEQILATLTIQGRTTEAFYFRTSNGYELELVLQWGAIRWALEIKPTSNPTTQMVQRLQKTAAMIGAQKSILLCRTADPVTRPDLSITNPSARLASL
jgi:predicted AAA+ superfamily ATPase